MPVDNEKVNSLAVDVLNLSRNTLIINLRFMDKAISMLNYKSISELDGFAVDGTTIYYDPVAVLKSFSEERTRMARQYLHMVLHCIYQHFWVSTLVNQDYWDLACDIAVEYTINDIGIDAVATNNAVRQLKEIEKLKPKVKYMTADMLYRYFMTSCPSEVEIAKLRYLFSVDTHVSWYSPKLKEELLRRAEAGGESQKGDGESQKDNAKSKGQTRAFKTDDEFAELGDASQLSPEEMEKLLQEWKDIARQMKMDLETFSKEKGDGAGGLSQNLMAVTREKYDYAGFLKKFAILGERMKINNDEFDYIFYTYGLKLYERMPLIEPLEYKDVKQVREFVVAIDTSGSTSGDLVQTFVQKTYNILKEEESFFTRFNLHIIQCDAEVQEDVKITSQREFDEYLANMKILGQGGTDFRPVFSYVDELIANHEFTNLKGLIYFTDGFGTFPSKQPDYNVAFVYVEEGYENPDVPVWAIKLVLQPDDIRGI